MQIGEKGTKYGLQVRGPARPAAKQPAVKPVAAAFAGGSDSEEEDNVGAQVARQAMRKQSDAKVQEMYAAALAEDPTAFDYDGVYDNIHTQKAAPRHEERLARRSRYIASLVEQAAVRKKEQDIAFERKLLKERQKEDGQFADEEKFVTSAYRRKLEEDKQWVAAQKLREAQEEAEDVRKKGNLNDFYANLMHKNVAFGAAAAAAPQQQQPRDREGEGEQQEDAAEGPSSRAAAADGGGRDRGGSSGDEQQGTGPGPSSRAAAAAAAGRPPASPDRQQRQQEEGVDDRRSGSPRRSAVAGAPPGAGSGDPGGSGREGASAAAAAAAAAAARAKRKADQAAVDAARERYLARKKQQAAGVL